MKTNLCTENLCHLSRISTASIHTTLFQYGGLRDFCYKDVVFCISVPCNMQKYYQVKEKKICVVILDPCMYLFEFWLFSTQKVALFIKVKLVEPPLFHLSKY